MRVMNQTLYRQLDTSKKEMSLWMYKCATVGQTIEWRKELTDDWRAD